MDEEQGQGNQLVESGKKAVQESAEKAAQKVTQKMAKETTKKVAAKASLMGPLGHIIAIAAPILIIIIILGGIILFLLTAPGMVIEKLKGLFREIADGICSWFGRDDTQQVSDEDICQSLDYLEEMGYDLKGYGFLTNYMTEDDLKEAIEKENKEHASEPRDLTLDEDMGVIRDDSNKIIRADSDFINAYLISDNYVYTVANKNLVTQNGGGFWSKVWGGIKATAVHLYDFFGGETPNDWTRGLINIWEEKELGVRGKFFSDTGFLNFDNLEIDAKSKTLTLKKSELFNFNGSMKYSLDGWTGRYGMPLEFLLSVHVATMMPDLAYDMANTFHTKINLLLHTVTEATVTAAYKDGNNYITHEEIDQICGGLGFDASFTTAEEAKAVMKQLHIASPADCTGGHREGYGTEEVDGVKDNTKSGDKGLEKYNETFAKMKELGYDGQYPASITQGADTDSKLDDITEEKNKYYDPDNGNVLSRNFTKYDYYYTKTETISWTGKAENGEECTYSITITITHYDQVSSTGNTEGMPYEMPGSGEHFSIQTSKITRGWTKSEWKEEIDSVKKEKEKNNEDITGLTDEQILGTEKCSSALARLSDEDAEKYTICENCRKYIKMIYDKLKSPDDKDFDFYIPYLENVIDHWYRDVYFTSVYYDKNNSADANKSLSFVDYDYDYEAVMKERWTKYETDSETGEYKLYAIDKNGEYATDSSQIDNYSNELFEKEGNYYIFKGSQEQAKKEEIAVSKKAETLTISDTEKLEDLGWNNEIDDDIWSAYKQDGEAITDWEQTYPDEDTSTLEGQVKSKIYTKISSKENLVQVGEGQRTETNNKIKKMFLQNKYLKYDGTQERAEEITKLRKDNGIEYGALSEDSLENEKISKYSSKVSLNQDSLNAFSMLENMHTLDADYIYRDFKELIVELGYFTKEELTDETPRLLQWLVPAIGSGGYPNRTIDKNENEFGTMVHSKGDIDANKKNSLKAIIEKINEAKSEENQAKNANDYQSSGHFSSTATVSLENNLTNVGEIKKSTKKPEEVSVEEFLTAAEEVHKVIEELQFQYCWGAGNSHNSDMPHTDGHGCAGLFNTLEEASASNGHRIDCSTFVSYVLQAVGLMEGRTYTGSPGGSDGLYGLFSEYVISKEEAGELKPGDILISDTHTQINGEDHIQYNAGSGEAIRKAPEADENPSFYTHVIRLPFNNSKSQSEDAYEGYNGNEAVVSPVTGILLDYGTYDDDDKSSITGEKYRQNVDLKYMKETNNDEPDPNGGNKEPDQNQQNGSEPQLNPEYDPEKPDKVGYAKILVLDAENYKKLEAKTENPWQNDSLVNIKNKTDENGKEVAKVNYKNSSGEWILDKEDRLTDKNDDGDDSDPWTEIAKTVYGYKEFAESYEMGGISGYVVYIDGFKCEKPDEEFTEEQYETEIPNAGKDKADIEITKESFKKVKPEDLQGTDLPDEEKIMQSFYQMDETHKMASKKATEKAMAEISVKDEASSTIYLEDENLIFIKEGTLLGRTLTDFELIESSEYRNETGGYEKYRKKKENDPVQEPNANPGNNNNNNQTKDKNKEKEENENPVIGNYLRIILRDTDDTVVENVEDYMKLNEGTTTKKGDQEYKAWEGDLEILAEGMFHEGSYGYLASKSNKFKNDQTEADYEMYCHGYSMVNKLLEQNKQWYGHLYDLSRTDRSPLAQVLTSKWYAVRDKIEAFIAGGPSHYTEKELEYAEYCLTYDCTSITKPYDTALGPGPLGDGYSTTPQGSVIPRAMCQQGGYGDGASGQSKIILVGYWDHNNNNNFDKGDELWGVDRAMEHLIDK